MNFILVGLQLLILRRRFEPVQFFQLLIGFFFGWLLDLNMSLTSGLDLSTTVAQITAQAIGCTVLGFGIAMEVKCGSVTMPGEGLPAAISKLTGKPFAKIKIRVDIALVVELWLSAISFWPLAMECCRPGHALRHDLCGVGCEADCSTHEVV